MRTPQEEEHSARLTRTLSFVTIFGPGPVDQMILNQLLGKARKRLM
jgi:hypothetical protein